MRERGVSIVGISGDSQTRNDAFREELDLPFPLVGDTSGDILRAYDVKWPLVRIAARVTYLVDRDRTIAAAHKSARDVSSHVEMACSWAPSR